MKFHQEKVERISSVLKERKSTDPLSLKKRTVSHTVPKPKDKNGGAGDKKRKTNGVRKKTAATTTMDDSRISPRYP